MNEKTRRRTVPKKGYPGIYDIEVHDPRRDRWIEPPRGDHFATGEEVHAFGAVRVGVTEQ